MTEQEKREKAIGEFAKDIFNAKSFVDNPFIDNRKGNERYWAIAEELTAKGYRKEEEVRKETAKEIFKALDEIITKSEKVEDILLYGKNFSKTGVVCRRFYVYRYWYYCYSAYRFYYWYCKRCW